MHIKFDAPLGLFQRYLKLNNLHITNGINEINIKLADKEIKVVMRKETDEDHTW